MDLAIISPTRLLRKYSAQYPLQYCYATLAVTSPQYLAYFREQRKQGRKLILEWSPELPRLLCKDYDDSLYFKLAELLNPKLIVIPSKDYDYLNTIRTAHSFISKPHWSVFKGRYLALVQGTSIAEIQDCYENLAGLVGSIGLSSPLELIAYRTEILKSFKSKPTDFYFLEVYKDMLKEAPPYSVRGFCTSYPIRLGLAGLTLNDRVNQLDLLDFHTNKDSPLIYDALEQLEDFYDR